MSEDIKSTGVGDTIAKLTEKLGLDKAVESIASTLGISDCGCSKRRETLNEMFPYSQDATPPSQETHSID